MIVVRIGAAPPPQECDGPKRGAQPAAPKLARGAAFVRSHFIALATEENTLLEFDPIKRIVPTTTTRMTANITAYSAMS
jgi:hypothetical protein